MPADLLASLPVSDGSAEQHHVGGGVSGDVDGVAGSRQCLSGPRHPNFVTQALELMGRRPQSNRMSLLAYEAHSHRYCSLVQSQRQERHRQLIPPSIVTASSTMSVGTSLNPQCGQLRSSSFSFIRLPPTGWLRTVARAPAWRHRKSRSADYGVFSVPPPGMVTPGATTTTVG
jgi:hypothetical protein